MHTVTNDGKPTCGVRILLFFALAPDEELTYSDVAEKFGVDRKNIKSTIASSVEAGLLAKRNDGRRSVISAGPELLQMVNGRVRG